MTQVLLADDDRDDAEIFSDALHRACPEMTFQWVEDGQEVIQFLQRHQAALPEIIFMDLNMPVMNGWQCLAELKTNIAFKRIPVVMYSTSSHPRDRQIATDLGALGLIVKPTRIQHLQQILDVIVCKMGTVDLKQAINEAYLLSREQ